MPEMVPRMDAMIFATLMISNNLDQFDLDDAAIDTGVTTHRLTQLTDLRRDDQSTQISHNFRARGLTMENCEWLINHVAYLRELKSRSDQQDLLILLAEKSDRSAQDIKKLTILIRAEKAGNKQSRARQSATNFINAERRAAKESERKANDQRLLLQGNLIDLAGLKSRCRSELLGILLAAAATEDPFQWASWKTKGDVLLSGL